MIYVFFGASFLVKYHIGLFMKNPIYKFYTLKTMKKVENNGVQSKKEKGEIIEKKIDLLDFLN